MAIVYDEVQRVSGGKIYSGEMLMQAGIRIPPLKGDYWSCLYQM